jgi:hypothetical protein
MIKDKFKKILENEKLKSFLSFKNNINNTITELKKKISPLTSIKLIHYFIY